MRVRMTDPDELTTFLSSEGFQSRAFPSRIYDTWAQVIGVESIKPIFFQDLVASPRQTFEILARFVLDRQKLPSDVLLNQQGVLPEPPVNRKEQHARIPLEPAQQAILAETFAAELRACRELFGEPVRAWANA
jgi:hypothetical protein